MLFSEDNSARSWTQEHFRQVADEEDGDELRAITYISYNGDKTKKDTSSVPLLSLDTTSQLLVSGKSVGFSGFDASSINSTVANAQHDGDLSDIYNSRSTAMTSQNVDSLHLQANYQYERKRKLYFTEKIKNQPSTVNQSPKFRQYINLEIRINSFVGFQSVCKRSTFLFAKSGFFYKGFGDIVACYHCGLVRRNWQADDDPILLHIQLSPNCGYIGELRNTGIVTCNDLTENEYNDVVDVEMKEVTDAAKDLAISS